MRAGRKQAQHAGGIGAVTGLAQDFTIYNYDRVSAENKVIRPPAKHGQSFLPCHAFGKRVRRFSRLGHFRNIRRLHDERNARVAQKLLATRRRGGEDEHEL
jgi:hypothetical protein